VAVKGVSLIVKSSGLVGGRMGDKQIDGTAFRNVLGRYPTGVTLVSAIDHDGPFAMVIGSFGSVSLDPPLVQFLPGRESGTWKRISSTGNYCVNVLGENQLDLSNSFFNKETDPFDTIEWSPGPTGSPIIDGCLAWIDCSIHAMHEAGDHYIVVGAVEGMGVGDSEAQPLLFLGGSYGSYNSSPEK